MDVRAWLGRPVVQGPGGKRTRVCACVALLGAGGGRGPRGPAAKQPAVDAPPARRERRNHLLFVLLLGVHSRGAGWQRRGRAAAAGRRAPREPAAAGGGRRRRGGRRRDVGWGLGPQPDAPGSARRGERTHVRRPLARRARLPPCFVMAGVKLAPGVGSDAVRACICIFALLAPPRIIAGPKRALRSRGACGAELNKERGWRRWRAVVERPGRHANRCAMP